MPVLVISGDGKTVTGISDFTSPAVFPIIPSGVTTIAESAFHGKSGLTGTLVIPEGITVIGNYSFENCTGFTSLTLPSTLTTIGDSAFNNCSGLTGSVSIPKTVTSIRNEAYLMDVVD